MAEIYGTNSKAQKKFCLFAAVSFITESSSNSGSIFVCYAYIPKLKYGIFYFDISELYVELFLL